MLMLILMSLSTLANAGVKAVNYAGHKVISVQPNTIEDLEFLASLKSEKVDLWNEPIVLTRRVMVRLSPEAIHDVYQQLEKRKMEFKITFEDVQKIIDEEKTIQIQPLSSIDESGFNFSKYHNLPEIKGLMKFLDEKYPDVAAIFSIGMSYQNRSIDALTIGKDYHYDKPLIILEFGIHAREWASVAIANYIMNKLVTEYGEDAEVTNLVDDFEFIIIPVANPDGYYHTHTNARYWRKTMSKQANGCIGVDPNRNFDIKHCEVESSKTPCSDTYCGEEAFSESEVRALRDLMLDNKDRIAAYFSVHAYQQLWMYPFGYKHEQSDNVDELLRIGEIGVKALSEKYGTQYELGNIADTIYAVSGSTIDYGHEVVGIPIIYALEVRDKGEYGFHLPEEQILPTCEETYDGIMAAVNALEL